MMDNKGNFRRNVLWAGNTGFMGKALEEKLQKEGWNVVILEGDAFTLYNPQIVLYFSGKDYMQDLVQALQGAREHGAERFLYVTGCSWRQKSYENFVLAWSRDNGLQSSIVVLPEIFGCGQPDDAGAIVRLFCAACRKERFQLNGRDDTKVPVLYLEDAVYAVVSIIQRELPDERITVTSEDSLSFMQVVLIMNGFASLPQIDILGSGSEFVPEEVPEEAGADSGAYELCIKPKYHVAEMLRPVYEWYAENITGAGNKRREQLDDKRLRRRMERLKPYLENAGLFALVVIISILQGNTPVNATTGLDISYMYIIIMGILYGKKQSLPAVLPAMALLTWGLLNQRGELTSIFYVPENIFHYSTYLFFGVFTGYITDSWQGELNSLGYKLKAFQRRYLFLQKNYQTSIEIKDKLYRQIVNSDDSIGWLYNIISQLDSVEVEGIFTKAAAVMSRIMGTEDVAIYVMGKGDLYLRQKVRLGDGTAHLPRSRKVEGSQYIMDMLASQRLFVNHGLQPGVPDLAAPILYEGRIIAVIEIYGLDFEQWSIYKQNFLSVAARLVSMAMGKAYAYEEGMQEYRFVPNTRILQPAEFEKLEKGLKERAAMQERVRAVTLELDRAGMNYQELDNRLAGAIRQEDAVGLRDDRVFVLLYDVDDTGIQIVRQRLAHRGVDILESRELV